jgi:hypothetical protein
MWGMAAFGMRGVSGMLRVGSRAHAAWLEARVRSENESCEEGRGILENVSGGYKACDIVEGGGDKVDSLRSCAHG